MRKTTFVAILILGAIGKQKEKSKGENTQMKANPKTLDTVERERERERERESYLNEIKCGIVRESRIYTLCLLIGKLYLAYKKINKILNKKRKSRNSYFASEQNRGPTLYLAYMYYPN